MTKQIKPLSIAGLIVVLVAGFGIFAATWVNNENMMQQEG